VKKENILYTVIGTLLGFIVGFAFANTTNRQGYAAALGTVAGQTQQLAGLPPDHPPVEGAIAGPSAEVIEAAAKLASDQPDNFDAQTKAAQLFYSAHRYDDAIKFFSRANKLRPAPTTPMC
jgi:tetratricopeptide (TPR) repeat protein